MKNLLLFGIGLVLAASHSRAADEGLPVSKESVRSAIAHFRQDPLSQNGRAAGAIVRNFAEKDDSVVMTVTEKVVPFLQNVRLSEADRAVLLAAYIVGNVDSQFLHNEKKDDPYAGVMEVIHTYRQMQATIPGIQIPEIDNFIDLEKRGELKSYVSKP